MRLTPESNYVLDKLLTGGTLASGISIVQTNPHYTAPPTVSFRLVWIIPPTASAKRLCIIYTTGHYPSIKFSIFSCFPQLSHFPAPLLACPQVSPSGVYSNRGRLRRDTRYEIRNKSVVELCCALVLSYVEGISV